MTRQISAEDYIRAALSYIKANDLVPERPYAVVLTKSEEKTLGPYFGPDIEVRRSHPIPKR